MKGWLQVLLIGLIIIAAMADSLARGHHAAGEQNRVSVSASVISEQQAVAIAQRHFKGRVLAISRANNRYRIKILSDQGAVHTVLVDAQTGAVVSTR